MNFIVYVDLSSLILNFDLVEPYFLSEGLCPYRLLVL